MILAQKNTLWNKYIECQVVYSEDNFSFIIHFCLGKCCFNIDTFRIHFFVFVFWNAIDYLFDILRIIFLRKFVMNSLYGSEKNTMVDRKVHMLSKILIWNVNKAKYVSAQSPLRSSQFFSRSGNAFIPMVKKSIRQLIWRHHKNSSTDYFFTHSHTFSSR